MKIGDFDGDGRPDVVIVGVDFPKLDGNHLAQRIRSTDQGSRTLLLAIDKGHLGKAKGVGSILDLKANGYIADPLKGAIDDSREAPFGVSGPQQLRSHHRRKGQRYDAGNDDSAGKSKCKLAE